MPHPLIALVNKLVDNHISLILQDAQLVLDPAYALTPDDQSLLDHWPSALTALTQEENVWIYWLPAHFDAVVPPDPSQIAWDHILTLWLHDISQQFPEALWVRMQWWKGLELKRDAFAPRSIN